MSRIGRKPHSRSGGRGHHTSQTRNVTVKGPRGEMCQACPTSITIERDDGTLLVTRDSDEPERSCAARSDSLAGCQHGHRRDHRLHQDARHQWRRISCHQGWQQSASRSSAILTRSKFPRPEGITFDVPAPTRVIVGGNSKEAGGRGCCQDPVRATARAVSRQGHPIRQRNRSPQGRQGRQGRRQVRAHGSHVCAWFTAAKDNDAINSEGRSTAP